jgi:hypothetical protein
LEFAEPPSVMNSPPLPATLPGVMMLPEGVTMLVWIVPMFEMISI